MDGPVANPAAAALRRRQMPDQLRNSQAREFTMPNIGLPHFLNSNARRSGGDDDTSTLVKHRWV
ncbi:MAG: hypothetical protein ACLGI6_15340 [Gammaproteobacteria bacterium]